MKYWKRVNNKGETTTVESYSHDKNIDDAIEITNDEYIDYISKLPIKKPKDFKDVYSKAKDDIERLQIIAQKLDLVDDPDKGNK